MGKIELKENCAIKLNSLDEYISVCDALDSLGLKRYDVFTFLKTRKDIWDYISREGSIKKMYVSIYVDGEYSLINFDPIAVTDNLIFESFDDFIKKFNELKYEIE